MMLIAEPWERACLSPPLVSKESPCTEVISQGIGDLPCSHLGDTWKKWLQTPGTVCNPCSGLSVVSGELTSYQVPP